MASLTEFLGIQVQQRDIKPRRKGLCMVIDTGVSLPVVDGILKLYGHLLDIVKITELHLTAPVEQIREKIKLYKAAGVNVQPGGIVLELARLQERENGVLEKLRELGFDSIEISASSTSPREMELEKLFAEKVNSLGFTVMGEVGKKFPAGDKTRISDTELDVKETISQIKNLLAGGAKKVYWEGHVLRRVMGDTAADILSRHPDATNKVKAVADAVGMDSIIFEVSSMIPYGQRRAQQFWMVRTFGPNVNIGNVRLDELQFLEHIRLGTWPVFGFGAIGDHPFMNSLERNGGTASPTWWRDIPLDGDSR